MTEPIRVLHNIASLHFGGSQAFVMNVYKNIDRTKVQFDFIVIPEKKIDLYKQVEQLGGRIYVCPKYMGKNHISYCEWWNKFFDEHPEYHVIHGHVRSTAAIYLKIAKKHGLVTIAHSHSTSNGDGITALIKNIMQLPIRNIADYLFACSDKAGIWLYGKKAIKQSNYHIVPNGINLEQFSFDKMKRDDMRKKLGIVDNQFVLGHIGRFTEPKNHVFLIKLFAEYHKKNPNSRLLMIGDGELYEFIKNQCVKLNISEFVIMPGSRINTEDYYQAMDVFVFPSLWEGLGIVAIEAQANGLPCIVSEQIPDEAILLESTKVFSLQSKDEWLNELNNINIGKRMKINRKIEQYDICIIANRLQRFYLEQNKKIVKYIPFN